MLSGASLGVGVVDDVGVAIERRAVVAGEHLGLEQLGVGFGPGHGIEAERSAVFAPRGDHQDVVRKSAANDVRHLLEDVTDVERLGHRMEQTAQAVDALAAQRLAVDDGGVLERQAKHVDDAVHQRLMRRSNASSTLEVNQTAPWTRVP